MAHNLLIPFFVLTHLIAFIAPAADLLGAESDRDFIITIFVVRRPLGMQNEWMPLTNLNVVAHSAILLQSEQGEFKLLEYMEDSTVYLTKVKPQIIRQIKAESYSVIEMKGAFANGNARRFRWTRQLIGADLAEPVSAEQLKKTMVDLMSGSKYSPLDHNCHAAQEKLRRRLGFKVD